MAERSEAKNAKRSVALKFKILDILRRRFASRLLASFCLAIFGDNYMANLLASVKNHSTKCSKSRHGTSGTYLQTKLKNGKKE